jgi:hypothetical protein
MSQFTFQTYEQWKSWQCEFERLLNKYGQSYEMFFLNDDGTLNYQVMIEDVDSKIRDGKKNFFHGLDKRATNAYRAQIQHSNYECLTATRDKLAERYGQSKYTPNENALEVADDVVLEQLSDYDIP